MTSGKVFQHAIRVPYAHTDQMRFVYYSHYLEYFEMARSELLREVGLPYAELEERGVFLPVVEAHCEYKTPAHFDDLLMVFSRCDIQGPRLRIAYEVHRDQELIVTGYTVHVCLSPEGKVLRPIPELRKLTELPG
ncbi:MAG: acyl-CoA thioesterase [Verrucomicrobia bacterium]|nr:acyl-CoA thioesterase [Verrucomicrobiota bacterium]MCG2678815.1 acyl-CoA thioesterase [Kiritimatiellia bacterium]MBU4248675.1 acyl-CoA thioesterase [Verrucomicrobiota bacterium]MBU4289700.1 acyl-CoA thioesterase [Verrucomicrobiota bacterium]MBU4429328.1 acyl-CoA thioesterase [Verrucomicrobiota bacterium]